MGTDTTPTQGKGKDRRGGAVEGGGQRIERNGGRDGLGEASRDGGKGKTEEMGRREGEGEISPPQSFLEVVAYG